MNYQEACDWLFSQTAVFEREGASAYKPGLDTIRTLCAGLGNPHKKYPTIHVAGTNGKGSTASLLAAVLQSAGCRTGLYTSPHLVDFRERIRVDGEMIPRREVVDFVDRFRESPSGLHPSFFELTTALAFDWFARQRVDVAVIEVGLGGRLDSTNIITPCVSIITNISLDHTGLLGSTVAEIAAEKAGIIKAGVPVVIGEASDPSVRAVFEQTAARVGAPLHFAQPIEAVAQPDGTWFYPQIGARGALRGAFQPQNAATVLAALPFCPPVSAEAVRRGFADVESLTGLRGRLTLLESEPLKIVYDTGHNPGAWRWLGDELRRLPRPLTVVCGFAADKDVDSILAMMPGDATYVFARPSSPRGLPAEELARKGAAAGLHGEAVADVKQALARARAITAPGGSVFIGGSNFLIADLLG